MKNSERLVALRRELSALRSKIADVESEMLEIAYDMQKDEQMQELKSIAKSDEVAA
jgi:uncharacterized protein YfcZ (UPF0381/DUF406 family)